MPSLRVDGLADLQKKLKENVTMDDVKKVVKQNGAELDEKMVANAEFSKGYQTGTTKRSIALEYSDKGLTASVEPGVDPHTEYSPYLEYGTRFMDAQPFVKPSFDAQKEIFKKDLNKLVR